jgi:hypothetical protein
MRPAYQKPSEDLVEQAIHEARKIVTFRNYELAVIPTADILPRESYVPVMSEMADEIKASPESFPPIIVALFGDTLMVVDGHHRLGAFLANRIKNVWAIVVTGRFSMIKWRGPSEPWYYVE